jgi:Holliday junction resolvasome RuvABC endonuclease subunit
MHKAKRDTAGLWDLQQKRFEGAGMRFLRLKKFLQELNPDFVVYEQVNFPHKSTAAAALYWGMVSAITTFCEENGIAYAAIMTNDLKKRATGKGGGKGTDKPAIVQAANSFFGISPPLDDTDSASNKDHNIADAMWLLQIALEEYASVVRPKAEKLEDNSK